ncbi:hypothetical protein Tco_0797657 [Tanacetum coccineum]
MTTARDTQPPYQTTAYAGGKLCKAHLQRRNIPCAPAIRKKNPNLLTKIVDRASKLFRVVFETTREEGQRGNSASISAATRISDLGQVLQQKTFTRLEASTSGSLKKHGDERDNLHAITTPMVTSREEIASPVELAKAYMGSRPSKAALRQDLVLHNNATGFLKSPNTLIAPKIANGFTTPRSQGRSAMYNMARTPYARSPSTFTEKGITSSYGREEALTSSQSAFQHGGKMALRSLEKVDSPKLLSYPHDNQKLEVQQHERLHDSRELTSKCKEKVEENGPKKFPIKFIFL